MPTVHDLKFPKQRRLVRSSDFSLVFGSSQFKVSHHSYLILAKYNHLHHARLGLVVSKKNFPSAIARNRIKRVIRESFRIHYELVAVDAVFLVRRGMQTLSPVEINLSLQRAWVRLSQKCVKCHENEVADAIFTDLSN